MRKPSPDNKPLVVQAYAGTTGVHLAWDLDEDERDGLLGFAIRRFDARHKDGVYLQGGIGFPGQQHPPGVFLDTSLAPIQGFRWGDYSVYPAAEYRYEVVAMHEPWDALQPGASASVDVTTEPVVDPKHPTHRIAFNRAVAASQAYQRWFAGGNARDNSLARQWLGRGLDQFVVDFLERASGPGWALDVAVYEYEQAEMRDALRAAAQRGVEIRIVYHAKEGDPQTALNIANLWTDGFVKEARGRVTAKICHHKTVVLSRLDGDVRTPVAVHTGSTNWTLNGLYYQANVGHQVEDPDVAGRYLALFERLWNRADTGDTRDWIDQNDPVAPDEAIEVLFSPRSDHTDLQRYVDLIDGAQRTVLFMTAFELEDTVLAALAGETGNANVLRYGLQNSESRVTGYDRTHDRSFTASGRLRTDVEGFLPETLGGQEGNILIHGKIILLDFDTSDPTVITGSANYSNSSSKDNDENTLVIHGDTRVADIYLCELFRWYDHYRFRYNVSHPKARETTGSAPPAALETDSTSGENVKPRFELSTDPAWADAYYDDDDPHFLERTRLAHPG